MTIRLNSIYTVFTGLLLLFSGCALIYDDHTTDRENWPEGPVVYLSITKAQAAGTESFNADESDFEDRIHDLAMLVFDSSTGEKVCTYFDEGIPSTEKEKNFTVQLVTGQLDFYFVANVPMAGLKNISTKYEMDTYMDELESLDTTLYLGATENKGFPMSRVYKNQTVTKGGNIYSPKPFRPVVNGVEEENVKLMRVVAKLEVRVAGVAVNLGIKSITLKNAFVKYSFTVPVSPFASPDYHGDVVLKKDPVNNNTWLCYMPEALMEASANWAAPLHRPVNYFVIETQNGTLYEIPVITHNDYIAGTDYLEFATGQTAQQPDYNIYRNRHYIYTVTKLSSLEIIYNTNAWQVKQSAYYMGYGYNVEVDGEGKITIANTVEACSPHAIVLKTLGAYTFSDASTEQSFSNLAPDATAAFTLNKAPEAGEDYLEVYYNGTLVKTFRSN